MLITIIITLILKYNSNPPISPTLLYCQNTDHQVIIYRHDHHYHFYGQCDVNKDSVEKSSSMANLPTIPYSLGAIFHTESSFFNVAAGFRQAT